MPTLHTFFSPSPSKRSVSKEIAQQKNSATGIVLRRGKRDSQKGDGSSEAPLRLLDDNSDSTRSIKRVKTKQARETSHSSLNEGTMGLCRIQEWENISSLSLTAPKDQAHILHVGAVLGRNISSGRRSSSSSKKIDLDIPPSAIGVSRKQLKVVNVQPGTVTIRQDMTPNSVGLYRYNSGQHTMEPGIHFLGVEETVTLVPGDVIEFDHYNRAVGQRGKPEHVFRVVTVTDTSSATRSNTFASAEDPNFQAVEPMTEKKKQATSCEAMEVNSVPASSADVNANSLSTPADVDDSFHTACENLSSNITDSVFSSGGHSSAGMAVVGTAHINADDVPSNKPAASKESQSPSSGKRPGTADSGNAGSTTTIVYPHEGSEKPAASKTQVVEKEKRDNETVADDAFPADCKIEARPPTDTNEQGRTPEANMSPSTLFATRSGTPVVRTPKVGDRFRAIYDREKEVVDDFLGFAHPAW